MDCLENGEGKRRRERINYILPSCRGKFRQGADAFKIGEKMIGEESKQKREQSNTTSPGDAPRCRRSAPNSVVDNALCIQLISHHLRLAVVSSGGRRVKRVAFQERINEAGKENEGEAVTMREVGAIALVAHVHSVPRAQGNWITLSCVCNQCEKNAKRKQKRARLKFDMTASVGDLRRGFGVAFLESNPKD